MGVSAKRGTKEWYDQMASSITACVHEAQEISGAMGNFRAMMEVSYREMSDSFRRISSDIFWFGKSSSVRPVLLGGGIIYQIKNPFCVAMDTMRGVQQ